MNNQEIAKKILELLGGKENIRTVGNCYTRIRTEKAGNLSGSSYRGQPGSDRSRSWKEHEVSRRAFRTDEASEKRV